MQNTRFVVKCMQHVYMYMCSRHFASIGIRSCYMHGVILQASIHVHPRYASRPEGYTCIAISPCRLPGELFAVEVSHQQEFLHEGNQGTLIRTSYDFLRTGTRQEAYATHATQLAQ